MSAAELNALERDVEQARARFADDLARLRSPANLTRLKNDLWADVRETKDEVVDKAKDAAQDGAQRLVAELKARAAAIRSRRLPSVPDWRGGSCIGRRSRRCSSDWD